MLRLFLAILFVAGSSFGAKAPAGAEASKKTAAQQVMDLSSATSSIEFLAVGKPSMLKIRGKAKADEKANPLTGQMALNGNKLSVKASFALNSLETGIGLRDRHMKEKYLETEKFPKADFVLTEMALPDALTKGDGEAKDVAFKGTLTIHGVPQEVSGTASVQRKSDKFEFAFEFGTKITGHKIELPSFMGVTVAEDVKVSVNVGGQLK